jgi:hypothetical protein
MGDMASSSKLFELVHNDAADGVKVVQPLLEGDAAWVQVIKHFVGHTDTYMTPGLRD